MPAADSDIQLVNLVSAPQSSSLSSSPVEESPTSPLIETDPNETLKSKQQFTSTMDTTQNTNGFRTYDSINSPDRSNGVNITTTIESNVPELPLRGRNSWLSNKQGATLVWRDVCVYATTQSTKATSKNLRRIINNASGAIQPGTLMAVMGSRCVYISHFFSHKCVMRFDLIF